MSQEPRSAGTRSRAAPPDQGEHPHNEPYTHRTNPYFGLSFYREEDWNWFFGRDTDCNRLITNLLGSRLTLVHAESGVGKSSLLRAGVAHRLHQAAQSERRIETAIYVPVVLSDWKDNPLNALCRAIVGAIQESGAHDYHQELPASLETTIENAANALGTSLLVILDQFEEYFQYAPTEQPAPERFADELGRCINRSDLPVSFLISIREDAYAGLGDLLKARIPNVYGNYLHIDYLDRASATKAIREPITVYNAQSEVLAKVDIETELVEAVLAEVHPRKHELAVTAGGAARHPNGAARIDPTLLQLVMEAIWKREQEDGPSTVLRLSTFRALNGADTIVDGYLGEALGALDEDERGIAIDALDHLVTPDGRKIAASVAHLAARDSHDASDVSAVLGKLTDARILRAVSAIPGQDPVKFQRYEILHDVLAPAISRVVVVEEQLREQRRERRLQEERWESRRERARSLVFRWVAAAALVVAAAMAGLGILAISQRDRANRTKRFAQSLELASYSDQLLSQNPSLSGLLARLAVKVDATPQAKAALRTAVAALGPVFRGNAGAMYGVDFSPDGRFIVTASANGVAQVWDARTARPVITLHSPGGTQLNSAEFSPDGRLIVTAGADGAARIWDAANGRQIGAPLAGRGGLNSAAFSPSGRLLVTAGSNGTTRIWQVSSERQLGRMLRPGRSSVASAAFSPDGNLILTAGARGTARIWSARTHRVDLSLRTGDTAPLSDAAFNPDGTLVVGASADGIAWIWNAQTGAVVRKLRGATGAVYSAAFSPDGSLVLTANADGTARIWNAAAGNQLAAMSGSFSTAAFAPSSSTFVAAGFDGTARLPATDLPTLIGPLPRLEAVANQHLRGKVLTREQRATYLVGISA
jgi:WD40 repeat protein